MYCRYFVTSLCAVLLTTATSSRPRLYMESSPASVVMPINDETLLICEMNVVPDSFRWRHYPLPPREASNPEYPLSLSTDRYNEFHSSAFTTITKKSTLSVKSVNSSVAGDYQCLAVYGAFVIASMPGRITTTDLEPFPPQENTSLTVAAGNTVLWYCRAPFSNPPAYIDYYRHGEGVKRHLQIPRTQSLIIPEVRMTDSGLYRCKAKNVIQQKERESHYYLDLKVVQPMRREHPRFVMEPKREYVVKEGSDVFLECAAVGYPIPKVTWRRSNGMLPVNRSDPLPGGLRIINVSEYDSDEYICEQSNALGTIKSQIKLVFQKPAEVRHGPRNVNITEGDELHVNCSVHGYPTPNVFWLLNGESVRNDRNIDTHGHKLRIHPVEKRHAGCLQCFAINSAGVDYGVGDILVMPKEIISTYNSMSSKTNTPRKPNKRRPPASPSKPTVSRLTDHSVMVRWTVPHHDGHNVPHIVCFRLQYKKTNTSDSGSKWVTLNESIEPNIQSYEVTDLTPDCYYRFRIFAVYSNDISKDSPKSRQFHLESMDFELKNPLPVPILFSTEAINFTSIKLFWDTSEYNATLLGFIIAYMPASRAGDWNKVSVDGQNITSHVITHLMPDTVYDFRIQSFDSHTGSEFSPIMKNRTPPQFPATVVPTLSPSTDKPDASATGTEFFVIVGAAVFVIAVVLSLVIFMIICHKWKRKKNASTGGSDRNDKAVVEEVNHRRIQADNNDYVMSPKTIGRSNGTCVMPSSRITITANPLADADNKSPTMIEMTCLSAQNNNGPAPAALALAQAAPNGNAVDVDVGGVDATAVAPSGAGTARSHHHNNSKHKRRKGGVGIAPTSNGTNSGQQLPSPVLAAARENYV